MRKVPLCPPVPELTHDELSRRYTIKVMTVMVGGGSVAGQLDHDRPIRPSAVRGHLRFWWRATRGAKNTSYADLLKLENEIWGSTDNVSPIKIEVIFNKSDFDNHSKKTDIGHFRPGDTDSYVMFPFSEKNQSRNGKGSFKIGSHHAEGRFGFEFDVVISVNDREHLHYLDEVEPALWAWINFGGVGARTRKGLGSLSCCDFTPKNINIRSSDELGNSLREWFVQSCVTYDLPVLNREESRPWPVLPMYLRDRERLSSYLLANLSTNRAGDFESARLTGIKLYKNFRQARNNMNANHPGRSYWPEADSIRHITGKGAPNHRELFPWGKNFTIGFPKAELGLPIVYHFMRDNELNRYNLMVEVADGSARLASPFIMKAMAVNDQIPISLFLRLVSDKLTQAIFKYDTNQRAITDEEIHGRNLADYDNSPLTNTKPDVSALSALSEFMKSGGYR